MYSHLAIAALLVCSFTPFLTNAQECDNSRRTDASQQTKIVIASVEFPTNDNLSDELRTQLRKNIEEKEISIGVEKPDSDWLDELNEVAARDTLMNAGYFHAQLRTIPFLIRAEAHQRYYALRIEAETGPLFRMGEVQFENATVFTNDELRKQVRLIAGEPFSLLNAWKAVESITQMYRTKGYIDLMIEPVIDVDDEKQQINLTFKLTEEAQYRVGSVEILGLNDQAKKHLMDSLQPSQVFDMSVLRSFQEANEQAVELRRDRRNHTVDVVVDFQKKHCTKAVYSSESGIRAIDMARL
jgi:outer membrane protein assembly factor BamA